MYGSGSVKESGMNAHKEMAGAGSKGNFGVGAFPVKSVPHPDAKADTGMKPHMDDSMRGSAVKGGQGGMMQAAPDHGEGMGMKDHFARAGKV